jgi:hypothetical protein
MSILKYSNKCNPAASAANVRYITRDSAADSISFHNLDELRDDDRIQAASNAINYAEERALQEECRVRGNENGTPRNHNRMIISFDRKESTEIAKEEVHKFLDKNFPNQKAVVSIHQDQDHTHSHVWFDCRDVGTDRKSRLNPKDFYSLDEKWTKQYDERYKTNYEREYQEKKQETREWKKEQYELTKGEAGKRELPENKPARHIDNKTEIIKAREEKQHGIDKEAVDRDKPVIERGQPAVERGEREMENYSQQVEQTEHTLRQRTELSQRADQTVGRSEQVSGRSEQSIDRAEHTAGRLHETTRRIFEQHNREVEERSRQERSIDRDDGRGR